jgi:predicted deacylase
MQDLNYAVLNSTENPSWGERQADEFGVGNFASEKPVMAGVAREILPVSRRADGGVVGVPLISVNGADSGPTLLVVGGTHGDEQEGIASVLGLADRLDPSKLRGTFLGVTTLNEPAYEARRRGNPLDDWWYDMNRLFPGAANGSITQRLASKCCTELVARADLVVLVHSGGSNLYCPARIIISSGDPQHLELARAMGPAWDLVARGTGERTRIDNLCTYCADQGKAAVTLEFGGIGCRLADEFDAQVEIIVSGILNVMRHYKMIPGQAKYAEKLTMVRYEPLRIDNSGFLRVTGACRPRAYVKKDTLLATLVDVLGNVMEEVRAPYDCLLAAVPGQVSVPGGTQILSLGRVVERL